MADFWKSLPRKYCDTCKCWFADNKASIEFHEKGKRHQENVQVRISKLQKKGQKEYEEQKKYESEMEKIEKAALEAFKKDLKNNPELMSQLKQKQEEMVASAPVTPSCPDTTIRTISSPAAPSASDPVAPASPSPVTPSSPEPVAPTSPNPVEPISPDPVVTDSQTDSQESQESSTELVSSVKIWYESVSPEGYHYYWNTETGESRWEPPTEGYVSVEDQEFPTSEQTSEVQDKETPEVKEKEEEEKEEDKKGLEEIPEKKCEEESSESEIEDSIGPQPKPDPYGAWIPVQHEPEERDIVDLELPERPEHVTEASIILTNEEPKVKFKEKTVSALSAEWGSEDCSFKKRKKINSAKRNVRRRTDD